MKMSSFKDSFQGYCEKNNFEKNLHQLQVIDLLINFIDPKFFFLKLFVKPKYKMCFYLHGGVGVGKTMILNFVYEFLYETKQRLHFNEFMINFHDYRHKMKNQHNSILAFV